MPCRRWYLRLPRPERDSSRTVGPAARSRASACGILSRPSPPPSRSRPLPSESAADLVLRGGSSTPSTTRVPKAEAVAVRRGRIVAVGSATSRSRRHVGPAHQGHRAARQDRPAGLPGRARPPARVRRRRAPLRPSRASRRPAVRRSMGWSSVIRAYATAHPDDEWVLGSGWYMGAFPGGTPAPAAISMRPSADRPAFFPNRDGHSAWVSSRALELAGIGAETPDPAGGRIERDPDGTPSGVAPRGGHGPRRATHPAEHPGRGRGRASSTPRPSSMRSGSPPGRTRSSSRSTRRPTRRGRTRDSSPPGWSARCGGSATGTSAAIDELVEQRAAGLARPLPRDVGQDHGRWRPRDVHRRDARAVPRRRTAARTDRTGILFVDPDRLRRVTRRCSMRPASRFTSTPSATGRSGRRSTPSKSPGSPTDRPTAAITSPISRSSIRPTSCASPRLDVVANAQPFWAAHERPRWRPDDPVPRTRADHLAVPVQVAPPGRRPPGDGLGLERARRAEPAARDGDRGQPRAYPAHGLRPTPFPARGTADPRRGGPRRSRWVRPTSTTSTTTTGFADRSASSPTSSSSIATCSTGAPARSARRGSSPRSSRASRSSRTRRSTAEPPADGVSEPRRGGHAGRAREAGEADSQAARRPRPGPDGRAPAAPPRRPAAAPGRRSANSVTFVHDDSRVDHHDSPTAPSSNASPAIRWVTRRTPVATPDGRSRAPTSTGRIVEIEERRKRPASSMAASARRAPSGRTSAAAVSSWPRNAWIASAIAPTASRAR